jgi:Haem-NO-binding
MKGIVFREFMQMVEDQFSLETADAIIEASHLASGGSYTSVGTYPHEEMVELVQQLSVRIATSVPELLRHFGRHLFQRFTVIHPQYVTTHASAFELLSMLDSHVHVEVRKLYRDAELPSFAHEKLADDQMMFIYRSRRALADFAHGLIEGCIAHFGEPMAIERIDLPVSDGGAHTRFTLTRLHG